MKGLIKNNFYAAEFSAKWLFVILIITQLFVIVTGKSSLFIVWSMFCNAGFALNAIACYRKENASKWNTYKLTMPVTRKQIVQSKFISHLLWMLLSVVMVAVCTGLLLLFHESVFEVYTDIILVFAMGICISFLLGAFFYPMHYLGGDEHNELNLGISIIGAVGVFSALVYLINLFFGFEKIVTWQMLLSTLKLLLISALLFATSYFASVLIFKKKEY